MRPYLLLINVKYKKKFKRYFDTEYERNCFADRLKHSKKLIVLDSNVEYIHKNSEKILDTVIS